MHPERYRHPVREATRDRRSLSTDLAGGLDFGKIPEFLQKLSLFERMAIARVRPFINLVELTPTGGHRICQAY